MHPHRHGLALGLAALATSTVTVLSPTAAAAPDQGSAPPRVAAPNESSARTSNRTAAVSMLSTSPTVPLEPCADDPSWLCGSVPVPIDRADPEGRKIQIGFQVFPHRDAGEGAPDPVLVTAGGPGQATTPDRYFFQFVLDPLLDRRDVVLVDNRGTGTSSPLRCPRLQDGVASRADFLASVARCGRHLGEDADRYGSGDIALDVEDVRRALGYPRINYFGPSYGAVDAQAYAVRFPTRVRSIVADAGVPVGDPRHSYLWNLGVGPAMERSVQLACRRAPSCRAAQADAASALARLVRAVREAPVVGTARDLDGVRRHVRVTELRLAAIIFADMLNPGEVAAAADALFAGDRRPLLRMGAENRFLWPGPEGDPAGFSSGAFAAAFCNDMDTVWEPGDTVPTRRQKFERAFAALPARDFAPFSKSTISWIFPPELCLGWPSPDRFTPAVPRGATAPDIPVLQLAADLDLNVPIEINRNIRAVFPQVKVVVLQGAGHTPAGWSDCARLIAQQFIRSLRTGSTDCARTPAYTVAAPASFPRRAAEATPATVRAGDASRPRDRRVATVAVRSVLDSWLRSYRIPSARGSGVGMRGGTFDFDYTGEERAVLRLHAVRLARDVTVRGRSALAFASLRQSIDISVGGPRGGTLRATGSIGFGFGPYRDFEVKGNLGGRALRLTVPAN